MNLGQYEYKYKTNLHDVLLDKGITARDTKLKRTINEIFRDFMPTIERRQITKSVQFEILCYHGIYKYAFYSNIAVYDYEIDTLYINPVYIDNARHLRKFLETIMFYDEYIDNCLKSIKSREYRDTYIVDLRNENSQLDWKCITIKEM